MARSRDWLTAVVAAGILGGCSSPTAGGGGTNDAGGGGNDVVVAGDTGSMDGSVTGDGGMKNRDGSATDVRTDRPATTTDRGPVITNPCATDAQIDLTTRTPNAMGVVAYQGTNFSAPETGGVTAPMGCIQSATAAIGYQVVHRYRMRSTAVLSVSTVSDNTLESLDTVVAVTTACSATGMSLGCNDDDAAAQVYQSTVRSAGTIPMGTEVFIVVGTYTPPYMGNDTQGEYELLVQEQVPVAAGQPCTAASVCVTGAVCIANPGSTTMGTCIADGTQRGRCRLPATGDAGAVAACDTGLTCSVATPTATTPGTCQMTIMVGGECGAAGTACATGSSCQAAPNMANADRRECIGDGVQGGNCRTADPRCEGTLQCSAANACRAAATTGGECDLTGRRSYCPTGNACAPNAALTGGVCAANGSAAGAPCRDVDAGARCDTGLTCSTATGAGVCRAEVAAGMPCDLRYGSTTCASGGFCAAGANPARGTCTAATAETEPNQTSQTGTMATGTTAIFSAALPSGDTDCFRIAVPANGSIRAETLDANGTCNLVTGADTILHLYNPMNAEIASDDDGGPGLCSLIDPTAVATARGLAAGTYAVCVEAYAPAMGDPVAIPNYYVRVTVSAP